jgi:hypothetical protein
VVVGSVPSFGDFFAAGFDKVHPYFDHLSALRPFWTLVITPKTNFKSTRLITGFGGGVESG